MSHLEQPVFCKSITDEKICKSRKDCLFTATKKCRKHIISNNITPKVKTPLRKSATKMTIAKYSPVQSISPLQIVVTDEINESFPKVNEIKSNNTSRHSDPCDEYKVLLEKRKIVNRDVADKNKQCEEKMYAIIQKYFDVENGKKTTYTDLLTALMHLYKENKKEHLDYLLTFHDFIQMFAKSTMETLKFKRQHVFEAMCKIMLLLNYDNGELGMNKQFYTSLEALVTNKDRILSKAEVLQSNVNESSKGGVVDILFKTKIDVSKTNCKDDWGCDCVDNFQVSTDIELSKKPKLIMIQNKYYDSEKTNNKDEYDIAKIYATAQKLENIDIDLEKQIVLMVNNKEALDSKLYRSRELIGDYEKNVYGVKQLEDWFRRLLHDLSAATTIDQFIESKIGKKSESPVLYPRFHQQYFTNTTLEYNKVGHKLFIWGAVPRSGKSYMIADFISNSKLRSKGEQENDIVLILGAKTETEGQFIEMFCKYSNFDDYGIIVAPDSKKTFVSGSKKTCGRELNKPKDKNIYILSQEWFKDKTKDGRFITKTTTDPSFRPLFEKGKIDIYFDEIHKGGSTYRAEDILNAFHNSNVKIDIFIMVTATFAKPNIRYNSTTFIDIHEKSNKIIQWSYEDQQMMKKMETETSKQLILNSKKKSANDILVDTVESTELSRVFDVYKELYGIENYLNIIAKEYEKHPELVIVSPEVVKPATVDIRTCFISNLKCEACKTEQSYQQLTDPTNIFNDVGRVRDLLNYIAGKGDGHIIDPASVYSYLKNIGAPTNDVRQHTELWFLPDKNLYADANKCRQDNICANIEAEGNYNEDDNIKTDLPNIEPLTRGLSLLLMQHPFFRKYYNILIVHNTEPKYVKHNVISNGKPDKTNKWKLDEIFPENIRTTINSTNLSESIKQCEKEAFIQTKSLIILTGAKLRLGISLPCADIAFNFDDVKSIDNNYQTMFRVLTERYNVPKPYGYYVDFNKDRAKTFLYEYNIVYGSGNKSIRERTQALQSLMFMFNYNGLGLFRQDTTNQLVLYNKLIKDLQLDEASYREHMANPEVIKRIMKKSIGNLSVDILKKLSSAVAIQKIKTKGSDKIKKTLDQGKKMIDTHVAQDTENDSQTVQDINEDEEPDQEDDIAMLINNFTEILPSIIALLAIFSDKAHFNCGSLEDCLDNCIKNVGALVDTICNCDKDNVIVCYLNNINDNKPRYTKPKINRLLQIVKEITMNPENEALNQLLNNIFADIKGTMVKDDGLIFSMSPEEIQKKIEEYLPVRSEEKDKHGEVFTPQILIDEMLDKLPPHVWKDSKLKWLDPANGVGNFPMIVYTRLMDGLKKWETDEKKRSSHIIQNMLYMVEINPRNVKIAKKIFGNNANICCADFLEEEAKWRSQFGFKDEKEIFDVIVGNPPFQPEKTEADKRQGSHGGKKLWDKFVIKSLDLLLSKGFLCFITPPPWRKPEHELYNVMTTNNQLLYLHIFGERQGQELFNVTQRIDLYIIEKTPKYKNTEIIDELGNKVILDLSKWSFLPNYDYNTISKIITTKDKGIKVIYDTTYHTQKPNIKSSKTDVYKYQIVHSINQDGIVFWYSSDNSKGHFKVPKVLLNFNRHQYPVSDFDGKYGMSQITFGIPITSKKQGDDIVNAINTDAFKEVIKATKWGAFQTDWRMFKYFKPDFYKYFLNGKISSKKSTTVKYASADKPKKSTAKKTKKYHSVGGAKTRKQKSGFLGFLNRYTRKNK
jgi:hypothetical protein